MLTAVLHRRGTPGEVPRWSVAGHRKRDMYMYMCMFGSHVGLSVKKLIFSFRHTYCTAVAICSEGGRRSVLDLYVTITLVSLT